MASPLRIGLTGGIGSGKSTVAEMFAELGAGVIDTDRIAHALTAPGGAGIAPIRAAFGNTVLAADGALERAAVRRLVFADSAARARLEAILHPMILAEAKRQLQAAHSAYVVLVVPLLAEHLPLYRPLLDRIAVVDCDAAEQLRRAARRPGMDVEQARAILAAQIAGEQRLAIADDVIDNRAGLAELRARVSQLHAGYLALAAERTQKNPDMPLH